MWTDFAWPFCYIGKRRLEDALKKIDYKVNVMYRCFELDPTVERDVPYNIYEKLASKYGMSLEQAKSNCRNMEKMAAEVGLNFQLDTLVLTNTFDAHRLTMYAKEQGFMEEMTDRLLRAYYTESKHIGNHATLIDLAVDVGLNRQAVTEMLENNAFADIVRQDEQQASEYGIRSIPFFLINKKYAITGAQQTESFLDTFDQILKKDGPYTITKN